MAEGNLWVCHRCEKIGSGFEAGQHVDETGHEVKELPKALSDEVRAVREKIAAEESAERVEGFLAYARLRKASNAGA